MTMTLQVDTLFSPSIIAASGYIFYNLYNAMKIMQNNKSPGNDGLTSEFYKGFWNETSEIEAKNKAELSVSGRQAIIKLIEKKRQNNTSKIGDTFLY